MKQENGLKAMRDSARQPARARKMDRSNKCLPRFLKPLFWETDLARIDLRRHRFYLIERLIEYGDDRAIHWLKKSCTAAQIAEVVRASRAISPNTASLWALILGIPRNEIECFSRPCLLPHSAFSRG